MYASLGVASVPTLVAEVQQRGGYGKCRHHGVNANLQVEAVMGNEAKVKTTDGATVTVALRKGPAFTSEFVEFEGVVNTNSTLTEVDRAPYGSKLGKFPSPLR